MARPRGFRLSRPAFEYFLLKERTTLSEIAAASRIPLTTLSDIYNGKTGASMATVKKLEDGTGCPDEVLFPELLFRDLRPAA